jgi:hypothetical protein
MTARTAARATTRVAMLFGGLGIVDGLCFGGVWPVFGRAVRKQSLVFTVLSVLMRKPLQSGHVSEIIQFSRNTKSMEHNSGRVERLRLNHTDRARSRGARGDAD